MRYTFITGLILAFFVFPGWEKDLDTAKKRAQSEHKLILLEFSGSDWCIPCIRFRKEVLETPAFMNYADSSLILLNADFPRLKKNQLPKDQQHKNNDLADRYNPTGIFPLTVLLDADGRKIKTWEGYPDLKTEQFIQQLNTYRHAGN